MIKWFLLFVFVMFLSFEFVREFSQNRDIKKILAKGFAIPIFCYLMLAF